jgi:hypothetical protein
MFKAVCIVSLLLEPPWPNLPTHFRYRCPGCQATELVLSVRYPTCETHPVRRNECRQHRRYAVDFDVYEKDQSRVYRTDAPPAHGETSRGTGMAD